MTLLAKRDTGRIQVQPRISRWPQGAREPRGTATVATAHLEDRFPPELRLRRDVLIKLDTGAIRFVGRIKHEGARRIFLKGVIKKQYLLRPESAREEGIPKFPDRAADEAGGE
jgi:hypothetical protein